MFRSYLKQIKNKRTLQVLYVLWLIGSILGIINAQDSFRRYLFFVQLFISLFFIAGTLVKRSTEKKS